jgi:hypothetical protein
VHKSCSNEGQKINKERLGKINGLIDHLNKGGEHPGKGLDKPDAAKLATVKETIQETRSLRAGNLLAKRAGDRMAKATATNTKPLRVIQGSKPVEKSALFEAKLKKGDLEGAIAQSMHEADQSKASAQTAQKRLQWAQQKTQRIAQKALEDHPLLPPSKPATMTVGTIAPGTTKPPQLIPQTKAIDPEVLPPEVPQTARSQRLSNLVNQLQANHEADTKNGAKALALAQTALQQLDPTTTPTLTRSRWLHPISNHRGTPKQRLLKADG